MSGKSKKTTADRTVKNQKQTKYISHSATKMVNRLSLSFYGQATLKMNKQVIMDNCDDYFQNDSQPYQLGTNTTSYSQGKTIIPKTSIIRYPKEEPKTSMQSKKPSKLIKPNQPKQEKKSISKTKQRSSSKSSRGKKSANHPFLSFLNNRIDITSKAWNTIRPIMKEKIVFNKKI